MQFKRLFETGQIGKLTTRNKLVMAPMSLGYTEYPYNFTRQYIDAIEERAKGGSRANHNRPCQSRECDRPLSHRGDVRLPRPGVQFA